MSDNKRSYLWLFVGLTLGFSWLLWIPLALSGQNGMESPFVLLMIVGMFSPSIAGIVLTHATQDREGRRDFWKRVIDFRRIGAGWYAVIVFLPVVAYGGAILLEILAGGNPPPMDNLVQALTNPLALLGFIITMIVGGPLAEELGWRGFALDRLQVRWNALVSSLVLGAIHAAWHLPVFFVRGTSQYEMGFGVGFVIFVASGICGSIVHTWIYNNTRRSTLSAILLHFTNNTALTLVTGLGGSLSERTMAFALGFYAVAAVAVTLMWGPETLTRHSVESNV